MQANKNVLVITVDYFTRRKSCDDFILKALYVIASRDLVNVFFAFNSLGNKS